MILKHYNTFIVESLPIQCVEKLEWARKKKNLHPFYLTFTKKKKQKNI